MVQEPAQPFVAGQECFGLGEGNELAESISNPQAIFDQHTPIRFG